MKGYITNKNVKKALRAREGYNIQVRAVMSLMWFTKQRMPLSYYHNAHAKYNFDEN